MRIATSSLTVGQRLEMRRRRRGLSRKVMANLVGRSEEWLRLVESGQRKLDSIELLARLADVLQIDNPAELIDWPTASPPVFERATAADGLRALRRVIVDHPALRMHRDHMLDTQDIEEILSALRESWQVWTSSRQRYSRLSDSLPVLVGAARMMRWERQDVETAELLVDTYHLARSLLAGCGDHTLAGIVADRSVMAAAQVRRPQLVATSAWHAATELLHSCHPKDSHDYALAAARRIGDPVSSVEEAVLWGALYLRAATAAAVAGDPGECTELMVTARRAAVDLGTDRQVRGIPFGPTEVGIAALEIALAQHDPDQVVRLAPSVELSDNQPIERRAAYHICQARAYVLRRDDAAATLALMKVAAISPEDLRHDAHAHHCLRYLIRRNNYLIRSEVRHLVELAGIAG